MHSLLAKTTYSNFAEVEDLSSRGCRVLLTKINLLVCQHCYTVYLGLSPQRASSAMVLWSCQSDSLNIYVFHGQNMFGFSIKEDGHPPLQGARTIPRNIHDDGMNIIHPVALF